MIFHELTKVILKIILLFYLSCFSITSYAQTKDITYSDQQWFQYYNQILFSPKWIWLTDGGYRLKDGFSQSSQYIARTGIGYFINSDIRFSFGFAHLGFYQSDRIIKREYRPYQELKINQDYGSIKTGHRFRVEERFFRIVEQEQIQSEEQFNFRFRYLFNVCIPVIGLSSSNPDRKLMLTFSDEIFINAGKDIVYNVFDQNRFLIGPVLQINDHLAVTLMYNHQFLALNSAREYKQIKIFWLGLRHNIDLVDP